MHFKVKIYIFVVIIFIIMCFVCSVSYKIVNFVLKYPVYSLVGLKNFNYF